MGGVRVGSGGAGDLGAGAAALAKPRTSLATPSKEVHLLALKVMRLTKPRLVSLARVLGHLHTVMIVPCNIAPHRRGALRATRICWRLQSTRNTPTRACTDTLTQRLCCGVGPNSAALPMLNSSSYSWCTADYGHLLQ